MYNPQNVCLIALTKITIVLILDVNLKIVRKSPTPAHVASLASRKEDKDLYFTNF